MVPLEEIFCLIDDFCKHFNSNLRLLANPNRKRAKECKLGLSEIMTIVVLFQMSSYRNFKDFYLNHVKTYLNGHFPNLVSYNRFIELMPHTAMPLLILLNCIQGKKTGVYYIDSTKLQVCHNLRISSHKVFKGLAKRGKTSTGWFFGFKLHIVINNQGEIMALRLTSGNVDDRDAVRVMTESLKGLLFGDRGYISKNLAENLKMTGLELITRLKKNMKEKITDPVKKYWLSKRGVVKSVIDQLKSILHIQHTRHRSPANFLTNLLAGILAYTLKPKKPSLSFSKNILNINSLISN